MDDRSAEQLLARATSTLEEVFGFDSFRSGQVQAIEAIARGKDCLVIMPTGSGKSLCYQVPALVREGVTLVVSPLIALMKDQVDALSMRGAPVTLINSTLSVDEQWSRLDALRRGEYRLLYVAPERFRSPMFRRALSEVQVSLLAVDEAHCISQWGHDFRPDYRRLRDVRESLGGVQAIALTATATPEVQEDIVRELAMNDPVRVITGFDRPNLSYRVTPVEGGASKLDLLENFLREFMEEFVGEPHPSGIIYVGTRRHAEDVASFVDGLDLPGRDDPLGPFCRTYHAGLEDDERRVTQESFMKGRLPCVAATNAFGMGVDKSDIRYVIHYDLPGSVESYYQEVGRAGRDGLPAQCLLLFSEQDRYLREFFIDGANPGREVIEGVHHFLVGLGENPVFRSLKELEAQLEVGGLLPRKTSSMAFRSVLSVLERSGALERLTHAEQRAEVVARRDTKWENNPYEERARVRHRLWEALRRVFERSDGEASGIRLEHWAQELEISLESLRRGFHLVEDDGWIRYTPPFRGRAIRLPEEVKPLDVDFEALRRKRQREEERLQQMLGYARSRACRRNRILRYFGDSVPRGTCGSCDRCSDGSGETARLSREERPLTDEEVTVVRMLLSGVARVKGRCGTHRLVQMMIGSVAKGVLEQRLDRLSTYGLLKGVKRKPIKELLNRLEEAGCVRREGDRRPVLFLTARGIRVMKAEERVELSFPRGLLLREQERAAGPAAVELDVSQGHLFERLRAVRRELASELGVPAYCVFHDRTLLEMACRKPSSPDEMLSVPGVGQVTFLRFGERFLQTINGGEGGETPS
ncbi:MAG: ATP-dependent DNA helicase [Planctomycetota bacterium]|nr:ATP-dependent DNA helicase [Planctomycetota bacterium]